MGTSEAVTRGIRVSVRSRYVEEHSEPERSAWLFAYAVTITNEGTETAQLLTRHWIIPLFNHQSFFKRTKLVAYNSFHNLYPLGLIVYFKQPSLRSFF